MKRSIFLYILSVVCAALFSLPASAINSLRLEPLEIPSEGVTTVNAVFTADQNIIGFQAEVIIPEGLTLVMTDDSYCYYPENTNPYQIISSNLVDNTLKVLGVTTDNSAFPSSGVLFSFKVQAESGYTGESMKLENIIFTTSDFTDINIFNVASIKLSETSWSGLEGSSVKLTATISPEDATNPTITWSSSNESVATVDNEGNVTAVKVGSAMITTTAADGSGVTASCDVTVTAKVVQVTAITLSATEWSGVEGSSVKLTATVSPDDATNPNVIWSSSDESVATVAEDGTVTAVKAGTAVITATAADGSGVTATCNVTVTARIILAEALTIDPRSWSGEVGESFIITAVITPEETTDKTLKWSSSDDSVASVDDTGLVTVLKEGSCVITVSTLDGSELSAECVITGLSGVNGIFTDGNDTVDVYSTQGILIRRNCDREELKQLGKGIYIIRIGNKAKTVIIR